MKIPFLRSAPTESHAELARQVTRLKFENAVLQEKLKANCASAMNCRLTFDRIDEIRPAMRDILEHLDRLSSRDWLNGGKGCSACGGTYAEDI